MKWDILLNWMTHLGWGSWALYRQAVDELCGDTEEEIETVYRRLRVLLSDMGHADFFENGTMRWRTFQPALMRLSDSNCYIFTGGRTRSITERLIAQCKEYKLPMQIDELPPGLSRISIQGERELLDAVAHNVGITLLHSGAVSLASRVDTVRAQLDSAPVRPSPTNWEERSWSFDLRNWVDGDSESTLHEFNNRHGTRRYLVRTRNGDYKELEKRFAIYAAALLDGVELATFDEQQHLFKVPVWAPLPIDYARAACLSSGNPAQMGNGEITYSEVSGQVAAYLLFALGLNKKTQGLAT